MPTDISVTISPPSSTSVIIGGALYPHANTHLLNGSDPITGLATYEQLISVSGLITTVGNAVDLTSNQNISGVKNFASRPTVNNVPVLLSGEGGGSGSSETGYLTGYVSKTETGIYSLAFYPINNPSGYITGVNLSNYTTIPYVTSLSGYLQNQIVDNNYYVVSGDFNENNGDITLFRTGDGGSVVFSIDGRYTTGQVVRPSETGSFLITGAADSRYYPLSSNPSSYLVATDIESLASTGYVTGISGYLQTQISAINSQSGNFVTTAQTGQFYAASNPANYITGVDLSSYSTIAFATGISGHLDGKITTLQTATGDLDSRSIKALFISGTSTKTVTLLRGDDSTISTTFTDISGDFSAPSGYLQDQITNLNNQTGEFYLRSNPSGYVTGVDLSNYATTGYVTGVSGYLSSLISASSAGVGTLNGLSGTLTIAGAGNNTVSIAGSTITVSGDTGFLTGYQPLGNYVVTSQTGQFYPINNPSGFITGVDLTPYATVAFVTGISGYFSGLISNLESTTGILNTRLSSVEGVTGLFSLASDTGAFLTTGAGDNRYVNVLGDTVSGNLVVTGSTSGQSFVLQQNGYIDFQGGAPSHKEGRIFYDTDAHTLCYFNDEADVTVNIGQEQLVRVSNGWTGTIENGRVVYASGAQGNRPKVYPASASDSNVLRHDVLGVATHSISNQGYITTAGLVNGLNTTGFSEGDTVYLSLQSGLFSAEMPVAPNHAIKVGIITRSHQTQGQLFVDIDQGAHLDYLHDIRITGVQNNDLFRYNSASGYWENFQSNFATGDVVRPNETGSFLTVETDPIFVASTAYSIDPTLTGQWGESYRDSITGINVAGSSSKTITLYQRDGTTLTANFTDIEGTGDGGTDYFLTGASFDSENGNLSLYVNNGSVITESLDGRYVTGSVVRPNETGDFLISSSLNNYQTIAGSTGISGYLQGQINGIDLSPTGAFLTTGAGDGRYYPLSSNPSSYLVESDLTNYATTGYVSGVSGYLQSQVSANYNSSITGVSVAGSDTKTVTLYQRDGGTLSANFTDLQSTGVSSSISHQEIYIDAGAMTTGISGASPTGIYIGSADVSFDVYSFGAGANSFSQFKMVLPSNWSTGDMTAKFYWTALNGSTGHVRWGIQSRAVGNDDAISGAWGTPQEVISQFITGYDNHVTTATSQISFSNSASPEDSLYFRVGRNADHATDTFGLSSYLKGVSIQYKISGSTTQW